ncbi:TAFII55 protein conserved region [Penicillium coprophilum]|uniref:TAFII55 protein conserved region n=1 Tax=Penicillium coprophilum TaxID=36646 RepID=UPI002398DAD0|nr:TAFII55 protein conserved region [Penicillium coprophilum]KAJ5153671.1 TAFII55 protein conserved region [Penicillium coprophilum]
MPLKIKFSRRPDPPEEPAPVPAPVPTPVPAPAPAPALGETPQPPRKLTLKIARKSQPEGEEKPKKKKTKKRPAESAAPDFEPEPEPATTQGPKRIKLIPSKKPALQSIRIKNKGIVPNRPVGVGYDSEASDTENDPAIEEQFILRMLPGEDCEHLRKLINDKAIKGNEFGFKPLTREGRRAVVKIRDHQYAAALVDLPCIIEGMKSWDRRGWYKSADICQMLLVLGRVNSDQEAMEYPLPPDVDCPDDKTLQYPHGLAPPLRWVRKRRFRDRVSTRTIEQVEKAVEELMAQDETSIFPPKFELVDSTSLNRVEGLVQSGAYEDEYDDEQDAYGEAEEDMMDDFEDALAAEMEAALAAGDDEAPEAGPEQVDTPSMQPFTPAGAATERGDTSGDESNISDEDEQDELDDDQIEQQQQLQQQREEVAELEALIRTETAQWEKVQNHILRNKMGRRIQELKKDLQLKKVSMGMPAGDDI